MDEPTSGVRRAQAAVEVASAALALARARDLLTHEPDHGTLTLLDYVRGWTDRALIECVEPSPETINELPSEVH